MSNTVTGTVKWFNETKNLILRRILKNDGGKRFAETIVILLVNDHYTDFCSECNKNKLIQFI